MGQRQNYLMTAGYRDKLAFTSEFKDIEGNKYYVHILTGHTLPAQTSSVRISSTPIVISREAERMGGIVVSRATVRLLSETDGQFQYLYQQPEGSVKLVLWRGDDLYYIGTLDPESYEEDYTKKDKYFVELRFSDFGVAKRLVHKLKGVKSISDWVEVFTSKSLHNERLGLGQSSLPQISIEWNVSLYTRESFSGMLGDEDING